MPSHKSNRIIALRLSGGAFSFSAAFEAACDASGLVSEPRIAKWTAFLGYREANWATV